MNFSTYNQIRAVATVVLYTLLLVPLAMSRTADQAIAQASTIEFGETVSGSIDSPRETDTYTFTANSGDTILIGMSRVSGDLWPRIRLYDPTGELLHDKSSPIHVEISQLLPGKTYIYLPLMMNATTSTVAQHSDLQREHIHADIGGTYTVLIGDGFDGTNTGNYNVYIQRLTDPTNATSLFYGQTISGSITQPAEMDTYTFSADAGDIIRLEMNRVSGDLGQQIRLYEPDGNLLNEDSNPTQAAMIQTLPVTGTYTVLASDGFNGTLTGSYNITLWQFIGDP